MDELKKQRQKINEIDTEMAKLFQQRMEAAAGIASYKKENGLPVSDPTREAELIERNSSLIENLEIREYYSSFLRGVFDVSKEYQTRLLSGRKIAYSGVLGAYGHIAATRIADGATLVGYSSFEKAYAAVVNGEADAAVLPIENSYAGDVGAVMDLAFGGSLYISRMIDLEICHSLMVKPGTKLEDIRTVWSHPQALAQCEEYIQRHGWSSVEYPNTAVASKALSEADLDGIAVIASPENAELYGLEILQEGINSAHNNTTRFGVFTRAVAMPDSTSNKMGEHFVLVFTVKNEAGALAKALNIIGAHNFNMRNLRSRPLKELIWNYYFFVELEGNINTEDGSDMLHQLGTICDKLKLLGVYELKK